MSENRKDSKGRVLRNNEYQKKDGRYEYRFTENGIRRSVYSWRLIESDAVPKGKKTGKADNAVERTTIFKNKGQRIHWLLGMARNFTKWVRKNDCREQN